MHCRSDEVLDGKSFIRKINWSGAWDLIPAFPVQYPERRRRAELEIQRNNLESDSCLLYSFRNILYRQKNSQ